jgi:hypothetical protein
MSSLSEVMASLQEYSCHAVLAKRCDSLDRDQTFKHLSSVLPVGDVRNNNAEEEISLSTQLI